ncbi:MAG: amylo-alpha-1,6-glucosidase [Methylocella sp.]
MSDIRLLRLNRDGQEVTAAGIPWFVGLFGRDSLIPSLQCLAFDREMAVHTARSLARRQGSRNDTKRHEEPGKILHELRVGEMANLGEIPQTPSFASIDSTVLFLILIARHAAWTGRLDLFNELRENVDRALRWMAECGDRNGDGYIEYYGTTEKGAPVNQGWKDSEDGIVREDGGFPEPPISLVEVQGYVYLAKTGIADLYRRAGEAATAERLIREAEQLRERFNYDFWMEDKGCYCLGLEGDGRRMSVVASNAGQALWTGIADHDKALKTAQRLMQEDMFSGWGVRTLSNKEVRYNPLAYQLGSIWPFDNSLIWWGFAATALTSSRAGSSAPPWTPQSGSRTAVCRSSSRGPSGNRVFLPPTVRAPTRCRRGQRGRCRLWLRSCSGSSRTDLMGSFGSCARCSRSPSSMSSFTVSRLGAVPSTCGSSARPGAASLPMFLLFKER